MTDPVLYYSLRGVKRESLSISFFAVFFFVHPPQPGGKLTSFSPSLRNSISPPFSLLIPLSLLLLLSITFSPQYSFPADPLHLSDVAKGIVEREKERIISSLFLRLSLPFSFFLSPSYSTEWNKQLSCSGLFSKGISEQFLLERRKESHNLLQLRQKSRAARYHSLNNTTTLPSFLQ